MVDGQTPGFNVILGVLLHDCSRSYVQRLQGRLVQERVVRVSRPGPQSFRVTLQRPCISSIRVKLKRNRTLFTRVSRRGMLGGFAPGQCGVAWQTWQS